MGSRVVQAFSRLREPIHRGAKREAHLRVCAWTGVAVGLICTFLTILNVYQSRGLIVYSTAMIAFAGFAMAISATHLKSIRVASIVMVIAVAATFTIYAVSGANEGFAILWMLVVPLAFCYFINVGVGLVLSTYFFLLLVVLFYTPLNVHVEGFYTATFTARFPLLYLFNLLLTALSMVQYHNATLNDMSSEERLQEEVRRQTKLATERAERLEDMSVELELVLAGAIDAKDHYTNGHSLRVAEYAMLLAEELGWDKAEVDAIRTEGLLHDIGKIGITDPVLNKPGRLTDDEYEHIKEHTTLGHHILMGSRTLRDAADVALWHHERWDGKGYPDGLKGEEIPLHARVIAIADAFDAMRSRRVYSGEMDSDAIRRELEDGRGTQFDPDCLDAFLRLEL